MIWCSGWELASAVSNAGGLGMLGSGSMYPETLEKHIYKCKKATDKPFGVNVPLIYPQINDHIDIIIREGIKIVITSAGNPQKYTQRLKDRGITVAHVVANKKFALKAVEAGVDAIVAEGFEAGGHNGIDETTTMVLIPMIREIVDVPLIAAGGIASGSAMHAVMSLGADGVQIGSRFAATVESSGHDEFKKAIVAASDGSTKLTLKQIVPVRIIKNDFYRKVKLAEQAGANREELLKLLGRGRAKLGMFEGDTEGGELEIGQVSGMINSILPASQVLENIINEFNQVSKKMKNIRF